MRDCGGNRGRTEKIKFSNPFSNKILRYICYSLQPFQSAPLGESRSRYIYIWEGTLFFAEASRGRREWKFSRVKWLKDIKTTDCWSERNIFYSIQKPFGFSEVYCAVKEAVRRNQWANQWSLQTRRLDRLFLNAKWNKHHADFIWVIMKGIRLKPILV